MNNPYPTDSGTVRIDPNADGRYDDGVAANRREVTDSSVGKLLGEVALDLSTLMRQEIELAKAELTAEAKKAGKGAGMLGGAGYAGHMFVLFMSLALSWALFDLLDFSWGWGLLIVSVLWGIVAGVLYTKGREQLKTVSPKPTQTVETLKEDVQWAKNRTK